MGAHGERGITDFAGAGAVGQKSKSGAVSNDVATVVA
jgi:hypothetical protein